MAFDTFISYNSADLDHAKALHRLLAQRGLKPWIDTQDLRPGASFQDALEESLQGARSVLACIGPRDRGPWQREEIRVALSRSAAERLPVIPVLLPGAPRAPDLSAFLKERSWVDLREGIDDEGLDRIVWGITGAKPGDQRAGTPPSLAVPRPLAAAVPRVGGTMALDSPFYLERPSDALGARELTNPHGFTLAIRGPRQIGKSSLLARLASRAESAGQRVARIDFQRDFDDADFEDEERFYRLFVSLILDLLDLEDRTDDPGIWNTQKRSNNRNATRYLTKQVLPGLEAPLVLAMDELDRVYSAPFKSNFFGLLRGWHNDDRIPVGQVLVISTEPQALIEDLHQSPFNVATTVLLEDFDLDQVRQLNTLHGDCLLPGQLEDLQALLAGHPYLVRTALYTVATGRKTPDELFADALRTDDQGPFAQHLRRYAGILDRDPDLGRCLRTVLRDNARPDAPGFYRLLWLGLIRETAEGAEPRNRLYADFFARRL
jgi:hypothetical protein